MSFVDEFGTIWMGTPTHYADGTPVTGPGVAPGGGGPTSGSGAVAAPGGPSPAAQSASALLQATLDQWGLGGLAGWAQEAITKYGVSADSMPIILGELRKQPAYRQRFAGMDELARKGRAISESEYIGLEQSYAAQARMFGLPPSFYDGPEDFARLIGGEVSPDEWRGRLAMWRAAADEDAALPENQSTLDELRRFGIVPDSGEFLALFIDPDRGMAALQQQFQAARIGSASRRAGFGELSRGEADRVAAFGVSADEALEGFGTLARSRELFGGLPGEQGADTVGRDAQLGAAFGGDAGAQERIARQRGRRVAEFGGGGGFAGGQGGVSGLGSASS